MQDLCSWAHSQRTCWMFLARNRSEISCRITGSGQRSVLLEGGLEIPVYILLKGKRAKLSRLYNNEV